MFFNTENELSEDDTQSLHRSRSSEDILNSSDVELSPLKDHMFQRRGAVRKTRLDGGGSKRCSVSLTSGPVLFPSTNDDNRFPIHDVECVMDCCSAIGETEQAPQKYGRNSIAIWVVKEFWKTLRSDLRNQNEHLSSQEKPQNYSGTLERKSLSSEVLDQGSWKFSNKNDSQALMYVINDLAMSVIRNKHPIKWISEESWTEIVKSHKNLSKTERDLQAAIWELITTEVNFLNFLWLMVEIFQPVFHKLQATFKEMSNIDAFDIFGNIDEIYHNNMQLWKTCIFLPVLKSRLDNEPLDVLLMKPGFLEISSIMEYYVVFMKNQVIMSGNFQRLEKFDIIFKEYVRWTRSYSKSHRDGVSAVLSTPFQRITKYKLLLDRIKSFVKEDQCEHLNEMISSVHHFLDYMDSVVSGEKRLEEIQSKLMIKNSKLFKSVEMLKIEQERFSLFDIRKSLSDVSERVLIHHGQLRLVINCRKKCDVQCYLFNDLFLICKPIRKDWNRLTIFRSPIRIDKFIVKEESESSFVAMIMNDFFTLDSVLVFIGQGQEAKLWIDKCHKTRIKYESSLKNQNRRTSSNTESLFHIRLETDMKIEPQNEDLATSDPITKDMSINCTSGYSSSSMESSLSPTPANLEVAYREHSRHRDNGTPVTSSICLSLSSDESDFLSCGDTVYQDNKFCENEHF